MVNFQPGAVNVGISPFSFFLVPKLMYGGAGPLSPVNVGKGIGHLFSFLLSDLMGAANEWSFGNFLSHFLGSATEDQ